jgi:Amt family ammonium transporter
VTFVYFPIAHMVWYWAGPEAVTAAAKAVAAAGSDAAKKAAAEAAAGAVASNAGLMFQWGALDFAGGTVVHINAGIAGLVAALIVGKRVGFGREAMPPHSLVMTAIGGALLWVGWFGFNAGSALEAGGTAALAMVNTFAATAAAALAWMLVERLQKGKPSLLGIVTGAVAGLVAVTPAAGFAGPVGSIVLGLVAGVVCYIFCASIKNAFGYDDALDVFGVHCIGGIIGAIGTAIVANPAYGGTGIYDYATAKVGDYDMINQIVVQMKAVGFTLIWSAVFTAVILLIIKAVVGLRLATDQEREGLDIVDHGERAYNY